MQDKLINTKPSEPTIIEIVGAIKNWFNFLLNKFKIICIFLVIGGIFGLIYSQYVEKKYIAELSFALEEESSMSSNLGGAAGIASKLGFDISASGGGLFAGSNIIEIMKSRLILEKTLLKSYLVNNKFITLADLYIESYGLKKNFKNLSYPSNLSRDSFSTYQDSSLKIIYKEILENNLNIFQKDKKVGIVSVNVKSVDQNFSKLFCESITSEASAYYIEIKTKKAKINLDILENQVSKLKNDLNFDIFQAANLSDGVYNMNPAYNKKGSPVRYKQIDVQTKTAILIQLMPNLELAKLNLKKQTPLIQVLDKPNFPLEVEKVGTIFAILLYAFLALIIVISYYTIIFLISSKTELN